MLKTGLSLMGRLRAETMQHHKRAESKPLERALVTGAISRELYVDYLCQRLHIHRALDTAVRSVCASDHRLSELMTDELYQFARLAADLQGLGVNDELAAPREAVMRFIADCGAARDVCATSVLGAYYVFEGSKNGARFISRAVRPALGLVGPVGWSYLDPHGEKQPALWAEFKQRMDVVAFSVVEMDEMISLAAKTFDRVAELDDEIWDAHGGARIARTTSVFGQ